MRYFVNIDLKYIINLCIIVKRNYSMFSKELLKGTLKPIILKLLSENDKMYGYEIVQAVKQLTDEKIVIKEGSLYPLLHSLAKEGTLNTESVMMGKRVRKYYSLTETGKEATAHSLSELSDFLKTIEKLISTKPNPSHAIKL